MSEAKQRESMRPVRAPRGVLMAFAALVGAACLVPFVGMLWAPTTTTTENRELAEVPALIEEDGLLNTGYLADWGTYFEDHFAYRNELVSANAELRAALFQDSAADTVVVGTDGWLYYAGTLADYCGYALLSERGIDNIAFNLSLMQEYVEASGAQFIVAFAPNKNTLYGENMPYWYLAGSERNLASLTEALDSYGVAWCDLEAAFEAQDEVLYYLRDSHWNTKGALLAAQTLLASLGRTEEIVPADAEPSLVDYIGDLNLMLYPVTAEAEVDYSYDAYLSWEYVEGEATDDAWVATSGAGSGMLLMYRDSFANNLLGFLATAYETAYFSKYVPYDLTQAAGLGADTVIIERAERNLADLGESPAIMPAPSVELDGEPILADAMAGCVGVEEDGSYLVVSGELPETSWELGAQIYIGLEGADGAVSWYTPFHITTDTSDYGYKAYFDASALDGVWAVLVACADEGGSLTCVDVIDFEG